MMESLSFLKESVLLGNEVWRYLAVFLTFFLFFSAGRILRFLLRRRANLFHGIPEKAVYGVLLEILTGPVLLLSYAIAFHLSMLCLRMSPAVRATTDSISRILFMTCLAYLAYNSVALVDFFVHKWLAKGESQLDEMAANMVRKSLRITILVILALYMIESLSGKPIGTILAGLGVGGLAVALAAQETIKNFFGSLVIMTDKPFQVGDRIKLGAHDGPIESLGFRSTRIRTLEGHLVTIPNSEVAASAIENVGKRPYIRRLTNITITYDTPPNKVQKAVDIIKEILENHEGMHPDRPPRVYFNEFNDASLNLLVIYWYEPPDYWMFVDFNHRVNMEILRRFNEEGIDFAFPTQTVHLANDQKRQLALRVLEDDASLS
jgi:MscS family membrane protein